MTWKNVPIFLVWFTSHSIRESYILIRGCLPARTLPIYHVCVRYIQSTFGIMGYCNSHIPFGYFALYCFQIFPPFSTVAICCDHNFICAKVSMIQDDCQKKLPTFPYATIYWKLSPCAVCIYRLYYSKVLWLCSHFWIHSFKTHFAKGNIYDFAVLHLTLQNYGSIN